MQTVREDLRCSYALLFQMQQIFLRLAANADPAVETDVYSELLDLVAGTAYGKEDYNSVKLLHVTAPLAKELTKLKRQIGILQFTLKQADRPPPLAPIGAVSAGTTTKPTCEVKSLWQNYAFIPPRFSMLTMSAKDLETFMNRVMEQSKSTKASGSFIYP